MMSENKSSVCFVAYQLVPIVLIMLRLFVSIIQSVPRQRLTMFLLCH